MNFVRNINKVFTQVTASELKHGQTWYADAKAACQTMADVYELPLRVVVGVVAVGKMIEIPAPVGNWTYVPATGKYFTTEQG